MTFPFLSLAFRLFRRSLGIRLLLVLEQLCKHLLEGIDKFLLGANHIELFPLDLGLLFQAPGRLLGSVCYIRKRVLSTEEFEAWDSTMAECDSLTSMPRPRAL